MQTLQGIAVSPGVAIGEALIFGNEGFRIPRRFVVRDAVDQELSRLDKAFGAVERQIASNRDAVSAELGQQYGAIFSAHIQMLRDPRLREEIDELVRRRNFSPEYAVSCTMRRYAKVFQGLDSRYLAARSHDIFDLEKSLLRSLLGRRREELSHLTSPVVVLAHDLTPSEAATLDRRFVLAFATEVGGLGGHTAIVAKGLEIPAIVGVGRFLTETSGSDLVIVDGDQGQIIIDPDDDTIARYRRQVEVHKSFAEGLESLSALPAEMRDGQRVQLSANIEFPYEVQVCVERGADGIGLYRTEFLYLGAEREPTEEDHYQAYAQVLSTMAGRPVVIRTLDLGADKLGRVPRDEEEQNPFLGLRSIRLSLRNRHDFRVQLRAVLRASALGQARIMFPMIATLGELRRAKMILADTMEDLEEAGVPFARDIAVGMMVEVPAAVMMIDHFLPEIDFLSLGTNDLIQYTLAVDRSNKNVADLYQACDPAVLRLIRMTVDAAVGAAKPVSVCGQMCSTAAHALLLLGMGIRELSVPPSDLLELKKLCRSVSSDDCRAIADRVQGMQSAREIDTYLRKELKKRAPELLH